ncbi:rhomboid family intramembrane serine protease [bacterium]|nr:rhomboid family intramembrane serine protease [bacterium]
MFMHAHLPHLLANLWALWLFGNSIEWQIGRLRPPLLPAQVASLSRQLELESSAARKRIASRRVDLT